MDHDDPVEEGDLLVSMINRDLEIQLTEVVGQISTNRVEERRVQGQLRATSNYPNVVLLRQNRSSWKLNIKCSEKRAALS